MNPTKTRTYAAILIFSLAILVSLTGCGGNAGETTSNGGTYVSGDGGAGTIYIVEKDGYKFAVLIGYCKAGITQIDESKKAQTK